MTIDMVPVSKLSVSARNVRRTPSALGLDSLKADIAARGVLQNLVAVPVKGRRKGQYEVMAGGRRLAAVQSLVADGTLPPETQVPVLVLDESTYAGEASLAENFQRAGMNPADECMAFRHFIESEGSSVEDVAKRFGVSTRFVEGRVRLGNLAEIVFEALRAGEISLDIAAAFGTTADTERQAAVWEKAQNYTYLLNPQAIRRELQQQALSATSPIARFVGEEAYIAAGGRIERDLFGQEDATFWLDTELASRIADEKLATTAEHTRNELGVAAVVPMANGFQRPDELEQLYGRRQPLSDEEITRLTEIEKRMEAIDEEWGYTDEDTPEEIAAEYDELEAERSQINDRPVVYMEEQKATATAFLVIDREGQPAVYHSLFGPPAKRGSGKTGSFSGGGTVEGGPGGGSDQDEDRDRSKQALSEKLADELAYDRAAILQLGLAGNPEVAVALLAFCLADAETKDYRREQPGFDIRGGIPTRRVFNHEVAPGVAEGLKTTREWLRIEWTEHKSIVDRFDAFRTELSDQEQAEWLAWCVARTVEKTIAGENSLHDHLGEILGIDVASQWRPTVGNFFGRVRKEVILDALGQVGGDELKGRYASAKKGDLAAAAERIFSGEAIIEPEARAAAVAWVPEALTFKANAACAEPDDGAADGEDGSEPDAIDDGFEDWSRDPDEFDGDADEAESDGEPAIGDGWDDAETMSEDLSDPIKDERLAAE
jgi:ParB family chromosome partitioning protein